MYIIAENKQTKVLSEDINSVCLLVRPKPLEVFTIPGLREITGYINPLNMSIEVHTKQDIFILKQSENIPKMQRSFKKLIAALTKNELDEYEL